MTLVVRLFIVAVLLAIPLACSQTESARETSSTASSGAPEDSSRIIPDTNRIDKTDESRTSTQVKQPSNQQQDTNEVIQPRTTTGSEGASQSVADSQPPVNPNKPQDANWDSTNEQDQVDVKQQRLNAARKKLRALSREQKKKRTLQSRQAKKYQRQAIGRLERHMNERGWKNFRLGESSSQNEGASERSGTNEDNGRD